MTNLAPGKYRIEYCPGDETRFRVTPVIEGVNFPSGSTATDHTYISQHHLLGVLCGDLEKLPAICVIYEDPPGSLNMQSKWMNAV